LKKGDYLKDLIQKRQFVKFIPGLYNLINKELNFILGLLKAFHTSSN